MAAILEISLTMQYLKYFRQHHNVRHTWKPHDRHTRNKNMPLLCRKWYQFIVWPWTNGGHLVFFTHNTMSKIFSGNNTMSGIHENPRIDTKNPNISIVSKMISIYCLTLDKWRPSWIFYPQCNVENIFWQYHYVRHTWNPRIDTKDANMPLLCRKWYQFIVWPWTNGGHLGFFTHNTTSKIFSDNATVSDTLKNPIIDTKNMNLPLLCWIIYQFIVWPWTNGGHLGFYPQGLTTLNEPKSKRGGYWLENPYPNYCFKWLFPPLVN